MLAISLYAATSPRTNEPICPVEPPLRSPLIYLNQAIPGAETLRGLDDRWPGAAPLTANGDSIGYCFG